jgi:hypothetical protein
MYVSRIGVAPVLIVPCILASRMTASQRRSRFDRSAGHRPSFDLLQAELESIVETLSGTVLPVHAFMWATLRHSPLIMCPIVLADVVARRRLRAGRDQIVLVTRAAKSKRIELESIILAHSLALQTAKAKRSSAESSPANRAPSISRQSASGSRYVLLYATSYMSCVANDLISCFAVRNLKQTTGGLPPHAPAELPGIAVPDYPRAGRVFLAPAAAQRLR